MYACKVILNGNIMTMDNNYPKADAIAIYDNKIIDVTSNKDIRKYIGPNTQVIDLNGRLLLPGFIDSHLHMAVYGINALGIDCRYPNVKSIKDIKEKIREHAKETPRGQWIRCWGYDHSKLEEQRHPTKWDLDDATDEHPVFLTRTCAHISTHNSMSLSLAGITDDTKSPAGGSIVKENGQVSGLMLENAHMDMMKVAIPNVDELVTALKIANDDFVKFGITSVHDAGGFGDVQMAAFKKAIDQSLVKIRVNAMYFSFIDNNNYVNNVISSGAVSGQGDDKLRMGPIKLMVDGSSSGPTAATKEPYTSDSTDCGIMSMEDEVINNIFMNAHNKGFQLTAHAVGDRAIETVIDAIEKAQESNPIEDSRHRVEHCAITNSHIVKKIVSNKLIPVPQPIFLYEFGDGYVKNYGKERVDQMFPCKTFVDNNIPAAGSSDCPITHVDPLLGIDLAVNRTTDSGQKISQNERIDIIDALKMFTINGAYASHEEAIKGSIEKGKLADLIIVSNDITNCKPEMIKEAKVDMTIIDGEIVYQRHNEL